MASDGEPSSVHEGPRLREIELMLGRELRSHEVELNGEMVEGLSGAGEPTTDELVPLSLSGRELGELPAFVVTSSMCSALERSVG